MQKSLSEVKGRIVLASHTEVRDVPGLLLVADQLVRRGYEVYLVPRFRIGRVAAATRAHFVLIPAYFQHMQRKVETVVYAGSQIGLHDVEGGLVDHTFYLRSFWENTELLKRTTLVATWGEALTQLVLKYKIFTPEQIVITGSPRFDFFSRTILDDVASKFNYIDRPKGKKLILINTNFTFVNPLGETVEDIFKNYGNEFKLTQVEMDNFAKNEWEAIEKFTVMAVEMIKAFPEVQFVLRPHPHEDGIWYEKRLEGLSNVQILRKGNILEWLAVIDAVIQKNCTTGLEAAFCGVPTISPSWVPSAVPFDIVDQVSDMVENQEDLQHKIAQIVAGTYNIPVDVKARLVTITTDNFHKVDGFSHKRLADAIIDKVDWKQEPNPAKCRSILYEYDSLRKISPIKRSAKFLRSFILPRFINPPPTSIKYKYLLTQQTPYFTKEYLQPLLDTFARVYHNEEKSDIQVKELIDGTVLQNGIKETGVLLTL